MVRSLARLSALPGGWRRRVPLAGALLLIAGQCHWAGASATEEAPPEEVAVVLSEWALTPSRVDVAGAGAVRFVISNQGALPHALVVEGAGVYAESDVAGSRQQVTLDVRFDAPGVFDLYCPVGAGQHRSLGQEGVLTVGPPEAAGALFAAEAVPPAADAPTADAPPPPDAEGGEGGPAEPPQEPAEPETAAQPEEVPPPEEAAHAEAAQPGGAS